MEGTMPLVKVEPDLQQKLAALTAEAGDEVTQVPASASIREGVGHATGFLYDAQRQGGGSTRLFKVLQTNACRFACR
jgi:predicted DNA-binding helix-hairpin-helix protein